MKPNEWKCACCGEIYERDEEWGEEEKLAEMRENIGEIPEDDRAVVCDDCYTRLLAVHPRIESGNA